MSVSSTSEKSFKTFPDICTGNYVIENKSVSRKHLVIKVAPVVEGEGVIRNINIH